MIFIELDLIESQEWLKTEADWLKIPTKTYFCPLYIIIVHNYYTLFSTCNNIIIGILYYTVGSMVPTV